MQASEPLVKHLLLVGGGHSHLAVLRGLGMRSVPGLMVTLVSREILVPYSGALPAYIAGRYQAEDMYIDLRPLARFAGARLIEAEVESIDLAARTIALPSRPELHFDLISLNIGSIPDTGAMPGAAEHTVGVKPIDGFLRAWEGIRGEAVAALKQGRGYRIAIVGGGPASVELACAAKARILKDSGKTDLGLDIRIISAANEILPAHNQRAREAIRAALRNKNIEILTGTVVTGFAARTVLCGDGGENQKSIEADRIILATGASLPEWPAKAGLAISEDGFLEVNRHLQSTSHEFVFVAGDAATIKGQERPKSGVYAVRQGKPLARNLLRHATGRRLGGFSPQRSALAMLNLGDGSAIASRGELFFQGRWVWRLKHWIDQRFLRKYRDLPQMQPELGIARGLLERREERELRAHAMRCGGCGAKVAGSVLEEVLASIPGVANRGVEDAALVSAPAGRELWQTVDQLKAFIDDPWLFARIATLHCLGDIHAMGARPDSALAIVGVPFASRPITRSLMRELMLGCVAALEEEGCRLLGGHSAETRELQFGLSVNGHVEPGKALPKQGMKRGDALILSKPLGTGTLLAADMRHLAGQRWMDAALRTMLASNRSAARIFREHGATACTDVTGFGLAGHLLEMIAGGPVELRLADVPVLDGALECIGRGIVSSLHADNKLIERNIEGRGESRESARREILFDPQTAGGLLAAVPESKARSCLNALIDSGLEQAAIIGQAGDGEDGPARIALA
ncbi:MAG: selenide, water dikinase SelD [Gammaproteobacteria bacterium]|nr:selenide, water dikinase SelD [Gammaproteobacteria bacterium]